MNQLGIAAKRPGIASDPGGGHEAGERAGPAEVSVGGSSSALAIALVVIGFFVVLRSARSAGTAHGRHPNIVQSAPSCHRARSRTTRQTSAESEIHTGLLPGKDGIRMGVKRRVFVAGIVVALGGGGLALLASKAAQSSQSSAQRSGSTGGTLPALPTSAQVPRLARAAIDELAIFGPRGAARLERRPSGQWHMVEPADAPADERAVAAALDVLTSLESRGVITEDEAMHAQLGVDSGIRVLAKGRGAPLLEGHIGIYDSGMTAFRIGGFPTVFRIQGAMRYAFDKRPTAFRDRSITDVDGERIEELEFHSRNGDFRFVRAQGQRDGWQQVVAAGETAIEPLNVRELTSVANIAANLEATEFYQPGLSDEETGLGSEAATMTMRIGGAQGRTLVYRIGHLAVGGDTFFLEVEGSDAIYAVASYTASRFMPAAVPGVLQKNPLPAAPPSG